MNEEKGLTLLVLIITIVVMIILATVTFKIASDGGNGGLIVKYKNEAGSQQQGVANQTTAINSIIQYQEDEWGM